MISFQFFFPSSCISVASQFRLNEKWNAELIIVRSCLISPLFFCVLFLACITLIHLHINEPKAKWRIPSISLQPKRVKFSNWNRSWTMTRRRRRRRQWKRWDYFQFLHSSNLSINHPTFYFSNPFTQRNDFGLGHCEHDSGQRCVGTISRCGQLHANRQFGTEKTGLLVFDELCKIATRHGHYGC